MPQPEPRSRRRYLMTLCHEQDCCPVISYLEAQPIDCCIEVVDDSKNRALFGPDTLLQAEIRPVGSSTSSDMWVLRDNFGDEVYMQLGQYGEMLSEVNCALIREIAAERGVGIHGLIEQARERMRALSTV